MPDLTLQGMAQAAALQGANAEDAQLLQAAWGIDAVCNHFQIDFKPQLAARFAKGCTEHHITPEHLACLIDWITTVSPWRKPNLELNRHADPEPYPTHRITVGKEYSRVLYIFYPKLSGNGTDWRHLSATLQEGGAHYGASEVDVIEDDRMSLKIRMWWG